MLRVHKKIALVTGGARGQGAAEATLLASEGAIVFVTDVRAADGTALARAHGLQFLDHDVTDESDWSRVVGTILDAEGRLDILVNNAGIFRAGSLETTSSELFRHVMEVNQLSVFLGMRAVATQMKAQRQGSIVNISSVAGLRGTPQSLAYGASKWAVRGMTKSAAQEFAPFGVRVNSVHPGLVSTQMLDDVPWIDGDHLQPTLDRVPMGRLATASDVAELVLFLASDESSYITGSEYVIDGGMSA